MSRTFFLPAALLDLTLARVVAPRNVPQARWGLLLSQASVRAMHGAALATNPSLQYGTDLGPPSTYQGGRLRPRQDALTPKTAATELGRRVQALQETVVSEESLFGLPSFSEEELSVIYKDLLALPDSGNVTGVDLHRADSREDDLFIVKSIEGRLLAEDTNATSSLAQPYRRVLSRAQDIVTRIEAVRAVAADPSTTSAPSLINVPVALLTNHEWAALTRVCVHMNDEEAAELSLDLMRRSGLSPSEESIIRVLELYVSCGNSSKADQIMAKFTTGAPSERQRDLHIKAHLKATPRGTIPTSALSVLHAYEVQYLPPPLITYTRVVTALFSSHSSLAYAQAWDLFAHMRYVAHPKPDALLYTLMIRACASSPIASSEPERALDLWTEMTVDNRIPPNAGAYGAIILACARSGRKMYVNEAFRLAREMLDAHRDAEGQSAFRPDQRTFCALLEGAKRIGDLGRVRWILAEMVGSRGKEEYGDVKVNEEVMMHVFHGYASYKPPFQRSTALLFDEEKRAGQLLQGSHSEFNHQRHIPPRSGLPVEDKDPSFSHLPPQSRSDVAAEAQALFTRIVEDTSARRSGSNCDAEDRRGTLDKQFRYVQLTPRLLNSYLSVHYAHSSLQVARELFETLFESLGVQRNPCSFVDALERCGASKPGVERTIALAFSQALWADWRVLEDGWRDGRMEADGVDARMVERAHVAMIRVLVLTDNVDRALDLVKCFFERYSPTAVRRPAPKPAFRSTRTILTGARPLVRMTSSTEIPDDTVPPLLTFADVEVLHHRLVAAENIKAIGYLKYVCKAYEGALRTRRDETMKARPVKEDVVLGAGETRVVQ